MNTRLAFKEGTMKRTLLTIIVTVILGSLTLGQIHDCGPQVNMDPGPLDPNQIALDPISGERVLVQVYSATAKRAVTMYGKVCDPDVNDVLTLWREDTGQQVAYSPTTGEFNLTLTFAEPGIYYKHFTLRDGPDYLEDRLTRRGTYAFIVKPANQPPSLCAGQPSN